MPIDIDTFLALSPVSLPGEIAQSSIASDTPVVPLRSRFELGRWSFVLIQDLRNISTSCDLFEMRYTRCCGKFR